MGMNLVHLDAKSIADAVDEAIAAAVTAQEVAQEAAHVAHAVAAPSTAGVVTPANAIYTQADQTALADCVIALGVTVASLVSKLNATLDALQASDLMA